MRSRMRRLLLLALTSLVCSLPPAAFAARSVAPPAQAAMNRPLPPEELLDPLRSPERFVPAPELAEWLRETFLDQAGVLYNPDHAHLAEAELGVVWTNAKCVKNGRVIAATAELPNLKGANWLQARQRAQLVGWFGHVPHFLITVDALYWQAATDRVACARSEHELYHCGQKVDEYGSPKYTPAGEPVYALKGHDVEEFVGVGRRYGAVGANVAELVQAVLRQPLIEDEEIELACGTCGARLI